MQLTRIGVVISGRNAKEAVSAIEKAEQLGIQAAWMTSGGGGGDSMTTFAVAAARTKRILLGTAIMQTFPRHPLVAAQQVQVIDSLAPGRFRLGVGPSHKAPTESTFGYKFQAPLGHLREYIHILKTLFKEGAVDYQGKFYKANARMSEKLDVPVMASALRKASFELCGEIADGAISWVCPGKYLRDVALPALKAGAQKAKRPVPPLIAHAPVCVHDNQQEAFAAAREQIANYPRSPFYAAMFADAGFSEVKDGTWSDRMLEATMLYGNESRVRERLQELLSFGATEVLVSPITAGANKEASLDRTLRLLADAAGSGRR